MANILLHQGMLMNLNTEMTENELYPEWGTQAYPKRDTYLVWEVYNLPWKSVILTWLSTRAYLDQGMIVCWQHVFNIYISLSQYDAINSTSHLTHWLLPCHTIILSEQINCQFQSYFTILAFKLQLPLTATSVHALFSSLVHHQMVTKPRKLFLNLD